MFPGGWYAVYNTLLPENKNWSTGDTLQATTKWNDVKISSSYYFLLCPVIRTTKFLTLNQTLEFLKGTDTACLLSESSLYLLVLYTWSHSINILSIITSKYPTHEYIITNTYNVPLMWTFFGNMFESIQNSWIPPFGCGRRYKKCILFKQREFTQRMKSVHVRHL